MSASNRLIVAILIVAALAVGFWMLLLSPQREEADKLGGEVEALELTLSEAQSKLAVAEEAKRAFPADYRQLVILGQAVPEGEETSSLLVELSQVSDGTDLRFSRFELNSSGEAPAESVAPPTPPPAEESAEGGAVPAAATVPPTEAAAAILPLGAMIGSAGLGVMPYTLSFSGNFFRVADFISRVDSMVETRNAKLAVDGRLITLDGFTLNGEGEEGFPLLTANFAVTTYVTPPEGITAGATPTEPAPASTAPEGESTGGEAQ